MVESTRFVRVMTNMANKVCNKKNPLVERRVYMRSEIVTRKYPPGYSRMKMVGVRERVVRANEEGPRGGQRSACYNNGPLIYEAENVRLWNERSASRENGPRAKCERPYKVHSGS